MPIKTPVKRLLPFALILILAVPCLAQTLLFKSGFEPNTTLDPVPNVTANGSSFWINFHGTDNSSGFTWPFSTWAAASNGIRLNSSINSGDSLQNHFADYIDTNAANAHGGSHSLYLEIMNYSNGSCCPQAWPGLGGVSSSTPIREFYERFWLKYPTSFLTQMTNYNNYMWDSVMYQKTPADYRFEPNVWISSSANYLRGHMPTDPGGINATCPRSDPVTFVVITQAGNCGSWTYADFDNNEYQIPMGQYNLVEIYERRSPNPDGRYFYAINGHVIGDYSGNTAITRGPYGSDIQDIGFFGQYSDVFPLIEWVDDWEIWSTIPCTKLPCGSMALPGSGGGPVVTPPPTLTSYEGAVGAVGVPFSYQIQAINSPTSFSGSVPAGLSLNTSTGLISGTPTSATNCTFNGSPISCQYTFQVSNASGKTALNMGFYINGSLQAPTIPYFWSSGNTLKWVTLGAGTVSLSINNGVGSVSGPNGTVNVSSAATYTLTATNSAGSASKSVAVTVGSGGTVNPPTGLTATVQ